MPDKPATPTASTPTPAAGHIRVIVRSREKTLFEGDAQAVTSYNHVGTFDILPKHANFISLISKNVIVHLDGGKTQKFDLDNAVLMVQNETVKVYLDIGGMNREGEKIVGLTEGFAQAAA